MGGTGAEVSKSISIHALREERDSWTHLWGVGPQAFQSTRSARSATEHPEHWFHKEWVISIHALREERDLMQRLMHGQTTISIHALREERDTPATT